MFIFLFAYVNILIRFIYWISVKSYRLRPPTLGSIYTHTHTSLDHVAYSICVQLADCIIYKTAFIVQHYTGMEQ